MWSLHLAGGYMRKSKGFALVQAMLFMMFVAAAISISMVVKVNDSAKTAPADSAIETFPVVQGFISYALLQSDPNTVKSDDYTDSLSDDYIKDLKESGFDAGNDSMTVTVDEH